MYNRGQTFKLGRLLAERHFGTLIASRVGKQYSRSSIICRWVCSIERLLLHIRHKRVKSNTTIASLAKFQTRLTTFSIMTFHYHMWRISNVGSHVYHVSLLRYLLTNPWRINLWEGFGISKIFTLHKVALVEHIAEMFNNNWHFNKQKRYFTGNEISATLCVLTLNTRSFLSRIVNNAAENYELRLSLKLISLSSNELSERVS